MARDKDTYIFRKGVTPNTQSIISSKNRIFAFNAGSAAGTPDQVGVIATFDPSQARTVEPVRGIGFGDQIAELVPGVTDPMTISVTRTALYLSNIMQAFGYLSGIDGIARSLKHHRWPFDIHQELVFSALAANTLQSGGSGATETPTQGTQDEQGQYNLYALLTVYEACWFSDYAISYAADTALVQETVTISVSDILAGPTDLAPNIYSAYGIEPYSILGYGDSGASERFAATS